MNIHPSALVETDQIGEGTRIWAFVHILKGAYIGKDCNICDHCFLEGGAQLGDNVTLKTGVSVWNGVVLEDNVFVGPNAVFTNDLLPRSKNTAFTLRVTLVKRGVSIGANATILSGITIGRFALVGIGSVVTRDVLDHALVYGNPARQHGWVDEKGQRMTMAESGIWISESGYSYCETPAGLIQR